MAAKKRRTRKQNTELLADSPPSLPLVSQFERIGGQLTPERVSNILRQADNGNPAMMVDLFHESRQKDGKLQGVCTLAELDVAALPWDIVTTEGAGSRAKSSAKKAKETLQRIPQFSDRLAHLAGEGTWFGYSNLEGIWAKRGSDLVPTRLEPVHCRRFYFRQSDGALRFGDNQIEDVDLIADFQPGKYIQYCPRVNGDVLAREGLARLLIWLALFRNWDLRDWLKLAELAWKPKREGIYKKGPGTSEKDILIAKRMLERWGDSDAAYHPDNVEYKLHWPVSAGKNATHKELADYLGDEMALATLGATDVVSPGANGARAAVETRSENKLVIRNSKANGVAEAITRHLVAPLIEMNWGPADGIRFVFDTDDTLDQLKFAQTVKAAVEAGTRFSQRWVREQLGAPEPKDGEETIGGTPAADPNAPGGAGAPKPGANGPGEAKPNA